MLNAAKYGIATHVRKVHGNLSRASEQYPSTVRLKFAGARQRGFESRWRYPARERAADA